MMIRWPEIITPGAWLRRVVNGWRGGPPATHAALLLSCLMLLQSCLAAKSKAILSRHQTRLEIAPEVHWVLKDGEGNERSGLQQRCKAAHGRSLPSGLQSWRRPHSSDCPLICLTHLCRTHSSDFPLHKLLHEGIQPSRQCCISAPASLHACAVPPQIERAEAGGASPAL